MRKKNLLIAGGGTGGHIAPALAVGERASEYFSVSYACTPRPVDGVMYRNVRERAHVMNPPRIDKGGKLLLPFAALRALKEATSLLRELDIHAVLGTGGYSAFFAVTAAWITRRPAALLETNAIPGKSNRIASLFCREAYTGFESGGKGLRCSAIHTGTPVSGELSITDTPAARRKLGLPEDRPVVLFLGGSQGAEAINDLALGMPGDLSVLLQCGERDHERVLAAAEGRQGFLVSPFLDDLSQWYSAAELAVARAGGQTIAELSAYGLPAVLVPFPFAAEDHQAANAAAVERAGGAILRRQGGLAQGELAGILLRLLSSEDELGGMRRAMKALYPPDPPGRIAERLRELAE